MNDLQILHNNIDNRSISEAADTITKIVTKELLLPEELFDPHENSRIGENRSAKNVAFVWPSHGGESKIELPDYIPADANLLKIYQKALAPEPTWHLYAPAQSGFIYPYNFLNYNGTDLSVVIYNKETNEWLTGSAMPWAVGGCTGGLFTLLSKSGQTYDLNTDYWYEAISNKDNTVIGYFCVTFYNVN